MESGISDANPPAPQVGGLSCSRCASGWPPIFQQARYSLNGYLRPARAHASH